MQRGGSLNFIDLFSGCGGFTLGMLRAGFRCLAAIDFNAQAVATLRANLVEQTHPDFAPVAHVLERDLTGFGPEQLAALLSTNPQSEICNPKSAVDVIVGGPPCQGFSRARMRDGANHGMERVVNDPRRHLYRDFLRYVDFYQPRLFVMENVPGLRNAVGGAFFTAVQKEARALGYRVHGQIEDAWELGVPQKRHRQLIIGVRGDLPGYFSPDLKPAPRASDHPSLWEAIGDLPPLRAGEGCDECEYDLVRQWTHGKQFGSRFLYQAVEVWRAGKLTGHVARPHSERDLRDFALLREGESSAAAMRRGVQFEFPYDKSTFKDRYTRQSRSRPCSTIVAHLSKDGLMFIHPTQNRSLTPREAARMQTFPDWFRFPASHTHAYQLIGNAVPPFVAEAVGLAVKEFLTGICRSRREEALSHFGFRISDFGFEERLLTSAPTSRHAAARELERLAQLDRRALRAVPTKEFLRGWHALLFLFPGLHPDNALDHGDAIEEIPTQQLGLPGFEQLLTRRHARSGWPVALHLIGNPSLN